MGYTVQTPMFGLAKAIFKRDFKAQFRRTLLGPLLALLAPVVYLVVFIFFRLMFGLPQADGIPMIPFLFSGIALWLFFSMLLAAVYPGVNSNMGILKKMPVNPLAFAFSAAGIPLLNISIYFFTLLGMSLYFGVSPALSWLCLPFIIILIGLFAMGLGLFVCSLGIYKRDIILLLPVILQLGMFVTPIFFSPDLVPAQFRWVVTINPMAHAVNMFRDALFLGQFPDPFPLAITCGMTVFAWLAGYPFFRRTLRYAADTL